MPFDISVSALNAFATRTNVAAHNIANVNTDGFQAQRAELETIPNDAGVRVAGLTTDQTPGALKPGMTTAGHATYVAASNTELPREMVSLMTSQRAFEANAAVIRTQDEMVGTLLDDLA